MGGPGLVKCPFCGEKNRAEVEVEIVSRKSGEVLGLAKMCRECHEKKQEDRWFEWKKRGSLREVSHS